MLFLDARKNGLSSIQSHTMWRGLRGRSRTLATQQRRAPLGPHAWTQCPRPSLHTSSLSPCDIRAMGSGQFLVAVLNQHLVLSGSKHAASSLSSQLWLRLASAHRWPGSEAHSQTADTKGIMAHGFWILFIYRWSWGPVPSPCRLNLLFTWAHH